MRTFILAIAIALSPAIAIACTGGQCTAKTAAGTQCSRKAAEGSTFCWQHARKAGEALPPAKADQPTGTCGAKTKAGGTCKNKVKGGGPCHLHR